MKGTDDVLDTLLLPLLNGQLQWSDDVLFLRARYGAALTRFKCDGLICEQSFKPEADVLERAGFNVSAELSRADAEKHFPLILILPPRQRDEARTLFARASSMLSEDGVVVAAVSNNEGARSLESDLEKLCGNINTLSKNKCRVFWSRKTGALNQSVQSEWITLDQPRSILNGKFISRPGVFAWDRIDIASALLAQHLPATLQGIAADLGAGYGYLSDALLTRCIGITSLAVYEAEQRALELARLNLAKYQSTHRIQYHWHDVTAGLPEQYDVIVTNPPFHAQGSMDRPDIGRRFIAIAAHSLRPGGQLWLVANRHLPYEMVLADGFDSVNVVTQQQGFKIIAATRAGVMGKAVTNERKRR